MSELVFNRVILQKHNRTLSVLVIVSLALNAILALGLIGQLNKKPIIVANSEGVFESLDQQKFSLDEEVLKNFTNLIATQYLNFNVLTLSKQIDGIAKYLDVQPIESILHSFKKNEERMRREQVTHEFTLEKMEITKKNDPFWVELTGKRTVHAGMTKKSIDVVYLFEIKRTKPSQLNPYGLVVNKIIEKKNDNKDKQS